MTTRVKVCGITRLEDAVLACELGAFAIGFIFWPGSRRYIDPPEARAIGDSLPAHVRRVGVFVDQPFEHVLRVADQGAVDVIQLHGGEPPSWASRLDRPVWKAVAVTDTFQPQAVDAIPASVTVLLDAHDPVRKGGTGSTIDWQVAAAIASRRPVILSGGITPENIRNAVAQVRPYAIDLSSGVESSPGIKDPARIRALFSALADD